MGTDTQIKAIGFDFITWMRSNWIQNQLIKCKEELSSFAFNQTKPTQDNLYSKCPQLQHLENNTSIAAHVPFLQIQLNLSYLKGVLFV